MIRLFKMYCFGWLRLATHLPGRMGDNSAIRLAQYRNDFGGTFRREMWRNLKITLAAHAILAALGWLYGTYLARKDRHVCDEDSWTNDLVEGIDFVDVDANHLFDADDADQVMRDLAAQQPKYGYTITDQGPEFRDYDPNEEIEYMNQGWPWTK
jgi:hypothetical protein